MIMTNRINSLRRLYFNIIDRTILYKKTRWTFTALLVLLYFQRSYNMSYYIITYLIGFYVLQLLMSYMTPKGLQTVQLNADSSPEDLDQGPYYLPPISNQLLQGFVDNSKNVSQQTYPQSMVFSIKQDDDDPVPLVNSMSQIAVWQRVSYAFLMGLVCTCFKSLQIDVFWPLLGIYFIVLVCYTIKKIIDQMQKHQYSWEDFAKK